MTNATTLSAKVEKPAVGQPHVRPIQSASSPEKQIPQSKSASHQQSKAQCETPVQKQKKGGFSLAKIRIDWLFAGAIFITIVQSVLLVMLYRERKSYLNVRKEDTSRIQVIQQASTVSQEDILKLEDVFLREEGVITFIRTMEQQKTGFDKFDLKFTSDVPQGKDPKYLTFSLTVVGNANRMRTFLTNLLTSTLAIQPGSLELLTDKEDTTVAMMTFRGQLFVSDSWNEKKN